MRRLKVLGICNALMDVLVQVEEAEFAQLKIERGIMHLVDQERQRFLLERFTNHVRVQELGGSAMNAMRALAGVGASAAFFGSIGRDGFGEAIQGRMVSVGIESHLSVCDEDTGVCLILITPDGERTMNTHLGASMHYQAEHVPRAAIAEADVLHFTGYQWSTDHQRRAVLHAVEHAKTSGTKISFDVADPFMVRQFANEYRELIPGTDLVFANAQEASELYQSTPEEAGRTIAKTGATAVIKLGAKGAKIFKGDQVIPVEVVPTEVVDTTAAGDMFAGGFLFGYTQGAPLATCGKLASLLASDVISRVGATLSEGALKKARELVHAKA